MKLSTLTIAPDTTVEISFYRTDLSHRNIVVSDGNGWVDILSPVGNDWYVTDRLPPSHANILMVSSNKLRIRTNGVVSASIQILSGEQYVTITE